jgi:eukaryotic-like serine/threonine-protein kinase
LSEADAHMHRHEEGPERRDLRDGGTTRSAILANFRNPDMHVSNKLIQQAFQALEVVHVRDLRDGGQKTVKVVRRGDDEFVMKIVAIGSSSPDALSRARREVELLRSIDHPHLVHAASDLIELSSPVEGAAWLEEFLDGDDLRELLVKPWNWEETTAMASDVARGLSALHAVGVVHRDLSASNVRRRSNGSYVVIDPGFARHTLRTGLTIGGQPGTIGFFTPSICNHTLECQLLHPMSLAWAS